MKIVINPTYGGFALPKEFCEKYGCGRYDHISRQDKRLVDMIESKNFTNPPHTKLKVVEIPDTATDYLIEEYDGAENVYYVVDGKIHIV